MDRIQIKKMLPFTRWDAAKKYGRVDDDVFGVLELETASGKDGLFPFRCNFTWIPRELSFTSIDDALDYFNKEIRYKAFESGWTPESE